MHVVQTPEHLKTEAGEESFNPDGLAQRSIKLLKDTFPDIEVRLRSTICLHHVSCFITSEGRGFGTLVAELASNMICQNCWYFPHTVQSAYTLL